MDKAAQAAVLDYVKDVQNGSNPKARLAKAKGIHKKFEELNSLMIPIYKPPAKRGIGTGKKDEGIETKIINLGRTRLAPMTLQKEKALLVKIGYINIAMAEIAKQYAPSKPKAGKGAREWNQYAEDMKKASLEMIEAANKGNPAELKKAAADVNAACNGCHSDFRDAS
jgi:hypothetical protein